MELVEIRDDVKYTRSRERRERRPDVTVGHRLGGQADLPRERERDVPADDEREPEHHSIGVDGDAAGRGGPVGRAPVVGAGTCRRGDHEAGERVFSRALALRPNPIDGREDGDCDERPPELERAIGERDMKEDRMHDCRVLIPEPRFAGASIHSRPPGRCLVGRHASLRVCLRRLSEFQSVLWYQRPSCEPPLHSPSAPLLVFLPGTARPATQGPRRPQTGDPRRLRVQRRT